MIFEGNVITGVIRQIDMFIASEVIAKGRSLGVDVWFDNHSFTETGDADLFYASPEEECVIDFVCWLQNTYDKVDIAA